MLFRSGAFREAKALTQAALGHISAANVGSDRNVREMALQIHLACVVRESDSQSTVEIKDAFERAIEIGETLGERTALLEAYRGLTPYYAYVGNASQALRYERLAVDAALKSANPIAITGAHQAAAFSSQLFERYTDALRYGREAQRYAAQVTSRDDKRASDILPSGWDSFSAVLLEIGRAHV